MLKDVKTHLTPLHAWEEGCAYQPVRCRFPGCSVSISRGELRNHEEYECEFRRYTCKYCRNFTDTYRTVSIEHFPLCPDYTDACPNRCGEYMVRAAVAEHLSATCPLQEVSCDYTSAGCTERCLRKDLAAHYENSSQLHSKLLVDQNASLQKALDENHQQLLGVIREQNSRFEELLRQQDLKHQQQLQQQDSRHQQQLQQQDSKHQQELQQQDLKHQQELSSLRNEIQSRVRR